MIPKKWNEIRMKFWMMHGKEVSAILMLRDPMDWLKNFSVRGCGGKKSRLMMLQLPQSGDIPTPQIGKLTLRRTK
jgi:hypothetical protein